MPILCHLIPCPVPREIPCITGRQLVRTVPQIVHSIHGLSVMVGPRYHLSVVLHRLSSLFPTQFKHIILKCIFITSQPSSAVSLPYFMEIKISR